MPLRQQVKGRSLNVPPLLSIAKAPNVYRPPRPAQPVVKSNRCRWPPIASRLLIARLHCILVQLRIRVRHKVTCCQRVLLMCSPVGARDANGQPAGHLLPKASLPQLRGSPYLGRQQRRGQSLTVISFSNQHGVLPARPHDIDRLLCWTAQTSKSACWGLGASFWLVPD